MALYETVFIARQDVSAKQAEDLAKNFAKIVTDGGATVKRTESWGLRNLAYKIKKNRKGHYTLLHIEGTSTAVIEMERHMKLNEDVLRYMTVAIDKLPEGPSAVLKSSEEGEEGGFRGGDRDDRGFRPRGPKREYGDRPRYDRGDSAPPAAAETPKEGE